MDFSKKLQELRKNKSLTQSELAKLLKVSRRTVCNWETKGRLPKERRIYEELSSIFDCPQEYLLSDSAGLLSGVYDKFGHNGARSAKSLLLDIQAYFSSDSISTEEKELLMFSIHESYINIKKKESPTWEKLKTTYLN